MSDLRNVTVQLVLDVAKAAGCTVEELRSYFKITAPEYNKKSLYVGKAKRRMTRLDVSGFVPSPSDCITPLTEEEAKDLKLGAVRGQILPKSLREDSDDVLAAVTSLVAQVLSEDEGFKLGVRASSQSDAEASDETEEEAAEETEEVEAATETDEEEVTDEGAEFLADEAAVG